MFKPIEKFASDIIYLPYPDSNIFFIIMNIFFFLSKRDKKMKYLITGSVLYLAPFINKSKSFSVLHDIESFNISHNIKYNIKGYFKFLIFFKYGLNYSNLVICVSNYTKNEIKRVLPNLRTKVIYNYPVVTCKSKNIFSFEERKYDFILVGTKKNKFSNESLELCFRYHKNPRIVVIGKKNMLNKKYLEKIDVFEDVDKHYLSNLYLNSRYLVFLSIFEGFGLPIIESQNHGCVPIVRNKEPFNTIVGNGGFLVRESYLEHDFNQILKDFKNNFKSKSSIAVKNSIKYSSENFIKSYLQVLK